MENFFKLHNEKIIGYKALTRADLGLSSTSHQTHIGLFDDVLTFLPNTIEDTSMFIYENNTEILNMNFARIQNPDGTYRSPKISVGGRDIVSVVSTIREIVKTVDTNAIWYLFWFGLESEQVVFWLFNNKTQIYNDITSLGLILDKNSKGRIIEQDTIFSKILSYIESNLDKSTQNVLKDLEIETQVPGKLITEKKIRKYDIKKAQTLFAEIGSKGEMFVAEYFDKLKFNKMIKNYSWSNKTSESGNPFDFYYQDLADNIIYLDVKTTKFDFEQKIIYSDKEINFALTQPIGCYNIYRVYNLTDNNANLRICKDCSSHFQSINNHITRFQNGLSTIETNTHIINIAFQPSIQHLNFEKQINLSR